MSTTQPKPTRGARRIDLEELCRLPSFYAPSLSWKGDRVAFYWDKSGRIELYVMEIASREVRQVSHGEVPRALKAEFVWSRDDRYIVFGKDQNGDEQDDLYRIEVDSGEVTQLTHDPKAVEYPIEFSPDDAWLTVVTNKSLPETPDQPGQLNLWKVRPDGSEQQPVTHSVFPALGGQWNKSGEWLSYVSNDDPSDLKNSDVYIVRPDGSESKKVLSVKPGSQDGVIAWHPDGKQLAVGTDAYGTEQAGVLDLDSGDVRWLTAEGVEEQPAGFSESGRYLLVIRNHESQTQPVIYDLTIENIQRQQGRELKLPAGTCGAASFLRDDQHLLLSFS
ncbi:MAG TPA: hypothetical protein VKU87_10275, partial [Thermomicrobiaceae bacterium]|nr:hypothetical protein [Thermomicrobiaceae bacterium]